MTVRFLLKFRFWSVSYSIPLGESELDEALSLALQIANTDDAETDPENLTNDDTCVRIWSEFTNHKTDLLFSTSQELNSSLVIFLREVSKSDHPKYSREDILSICLGLQHFISDNNRPDCIFTDKAFSKFTTLLHKVLDVPPPTSKCSWCSCSLNFFHFSYRWSSTLHWWGCIVGDKSAWSAFSTSPLEYSCLLQYEIP